MYYKLLFFLWGYFYMLKPKSFLAIALASLMMATTVTIINVDADSQTSTASFEVADKGTLKLNSVPSFEFGSVSATEMLTGTTKEITNTSDNQLSVTDTRGLGDNQWSLSASLTSPFTSGSDSLTGAYLTLGTVAGTNDAGGYTQTNGGDIKNGTSSANLNVVATDGAVAGTSNYNYTSTSAPQSTPAAGLTIPSTSAFSQGTYTGEITWTLTSAQ
mgnify:CR=1 FL=1